MAPIAQAPPILNFSVFYGDDEEAKAKLVDNVRECCLHNGFFQIVGHRVPTELQNEVLKSLKSFFSLPQAEKEKVHKDKTAWNRGYENLSFQILEAGANPDQKEGFYVGEEITKERPYFLGKKLNSGPNQWSEGFPDAELFRRASMEYYTHLHALAEFGMEELTTAIVFGPLRRGLAKRGARFGVIQSTNTTTITSKPIQRGSRLVSWFRVLFDRHSQCPNWC